MTLNTRDARSTFTLGMSTPAVASWVTTVLTSVVFFVIGILSLKQADRAFGDVRASPRPSLGPIANVMLVFVGAILGFLVLAVDASTRKVFVDFFAHPASRTRVLPWIILFAVAMFVGNALFFVGLVQAPNPGYARAVMSVEVVAVTLLSTVLFDARLTTTGIIGVICVAVGVVLLTTSWM